MILLAAFAGYLVEGSLDPLYLVQILSGQYLCWLDAQYLAPVSVDVAFLFCANDHDADNEKRVFGMLTSVLYLALCVRFYPQGTEML